MKYEILNPSDKAFIEGEPLACALATCLLGNCKYGLATLDMEPFMPIFIFGGVTEWFKKTFDVELNTDLLDKHKKDIKQALESVKLSGDRSSLNDIVGYAHKIAEKL
jgi:hypothetical protein